MGVKPSSSDTGPAQRFTGKQIVTWFQADYGIFYAGKFLKETQPGRNLNYWALWAGYKS
jgi:hypothetical protein